MTITTTTLLLLSVCVLTGLFTSEITWDQDLRVWPKQETSETDVGRFSAGCLYYHQTISVKTLKEDCISHFLQTTINQFNSDPEMKQGVRIGSSVSLGQPALAMVSPSEHR